MYIKCKCINEKPWVCGMPVFLKIFFYTFANESPANQSAYVHVGTYLLEI
jgi:hypothetical protein